MVFGDKHSESFFEFFCSKNFLALFLTFCRQPEFTPVKVQVIQTVAILVQNISNEASLFYILSNNYINELIVTNFDFRHEEMISQYISLLKTLSLKLNENTINFFFNERAEEEVDKFPLFTRSLKFYSHEEAMVRVAVRTISLNVFKIKHAAMIKFISSPVTFDYLSNLVGFARELCLQIQAQLDIASVKNEGLLPEFFDKFMDTLYYMQDIFDIGIDKINDFLSDAFISQLMLPVLLGGLINGESTKRGDGQLHSSLCLFLLGSIFEVFSHKPILNFMTMSLFQQEEPTFTVRSTYGYDSDRTESGSVSLDSSFASPEKHPTNEVNAPWLLIRCEQHLLVTQNFESFSIVGLGEGVLSIFKGFSKKDEAVIQSELYELLGESGFEFMSELLKNGDAISKITAGQLRSVSDADMKEFRSQFLKEREKDESEGRRSPAAVDGRKSPAALLPREKENDPEKEDGVTTPPRGHLASERIDGDDINVESVKFDDVVISPKSKSEKTTEESVYGQIAEVLDDDRRDSYSNIYLYSFHKALGKMKDDRMNLCSLVLLYKCLRCHDKIDYDVIEKASLVAAKKVKLNVSETIHEDGTPGEKLSSDVVVYPLDIVHRLLELMGGPAIRTATLRLCCAIITDLVSPIEGSKPVVFSEEHAKLINGLYQDATTKLLSHAETKGVAFIKLFTETYFWEDKDKLSATKVSDHIQCIIPVTQTDVHPANMDFRYPESDKQLTMLDIHRWLILRRFYHTVCKATDTTLPAAALGTFVLAEGERIELSDKTPYVPCQTAPDAQNPRGRRMFLVLGRSWLVLVATDEDSKMRGVACSVAPLLQVVAQVEPTAPRVLHLFVQSRNPVGSAHKKIPYIQQPGDRPQPPTWDVVVFFSSDTVAFQTKTIIDNNKSLHEQSRLSQLTTLFTASSPMPEISKGVVKS
jgi:hypothetical protein